MLHTVTGVAQLLSATLQEKLGAGSVRTACEATRHGCVCRARLQHSERSGLRMTELLNNPMCVSCVNQEAWKSNKAIVERSIHAPKAWSKLLPTKLDVERENDGERERVCLSDNWNSVLLTLEPTRMRGSGLWLSEGR